MELSLNDLMREYYKAFLPPNVINGTVQSTAGSTLDESLNAYNSVTNPGADAVIANIVAPEAGLYNVYVKYYLSGSGFAAGDINNFRIARSGSAILSRLLCPNNGPTNASAFNDITVRMRLSGSQDIEVRTVGAAGAATVAYNANIVATKVSD